MGQRRNWAGNVTYRAARVHEPQSKVELQEIVAQCTKAKVVGTRHSFNHIADTDEDHISLQHMNRVLDLDKTKQTVTIEGGMRYGELSRYLADKGYALQNMASLPHISVAGACTTATHGSGDRNGSLATAVREMEIMKADGEVVVFSRDAEPSSYTLNTKTLTAINKSTSVINTNQADNEFYGAVVHLGGLGVVSELTLDIEPAFQMKQDVYKNLALSELESHFDCIFSSAYSVSLFTDWKQSAFNQVWQKIRVDEATETTTGSETFFGASKAEAACHPVPGHSTEHCTQQLGIPGSWQERMPHFRLQFTPSSGEELQSEYILPRSAAYEALCAINQMRDEIAPLLYISEVRTIAADHFWMSPFYKQDAVGIHFTWKSNWPEVSKVLPKLEEQLAPFQARPHWGKLFTMEPTQVQALYERLPDFRQLLVKYDPKGTFSNSFLDTYIFGGRG